MDCLLYARHGVKQRTDPETKTDKETRTEFRWHSPGKSSWQEEVMPEPLGFPPQTRKTGIEVQD